jgi:hypothetical protein
MGVELDVVVPVNDSIPGTDDLSLGYCGVSVAEFWEQAIGRLADDGERVEHGVLEHETIVQVGA